MNGISYINIFYIFLVLAITFLLISVFLFFYLHIPKIISDLSGKSSQKGIKQLRSQSNSPTGNVNAPGKPPKKHSKTNSGSSERKTNRSNVAYSDMKTDPIGPVFNSGNAGIGQETAVLDAGNNAPYAEATEVLDASYNASYASEATEVLDGGGSASYSEATTLLGAEDKTVGVPTQLAGGDATTVLGAEPAAGQTMQEQFVIEEDESYTDSAEVIE